MSRRIRLTERLAAAWVTALLVSAPSGAAAHDIPNDVTVYAFLKPEGQWLKLLVRVPLTALIDVDWPRRGVDRLDLPRATPFLTDAATLWLADNVTVYEGDMALTYPRVERVRASLFSDRSFDSYEHALATLIGPRLGDDEDVSLKSGFLDTLFAYTIQSDRSRFSVEPRFGRLGIRAATVLRALLPDGTMRVFDVTGNPGIIRLDPTSTQVAGRFARLGWNLVFQNTTALLFLALLVVPFGRLAFSRSADLIGTVAAFTAAYSIPFVASGYDITPDALWFPPLIDTLATASIVYVAVENIAGINMPRRWLVALVLGFVHGLGLALGARPWLQFAGGYRLVALVSSNVGIEIGQLVMLAVLVPSLWLLFRVVVSERVGTIVLSALVAHSAWHGMLDRGRVLSRYQLSWPELTPSFLARVLRWMMVVVAVAGVVWLANVMRRAWRASGSFRPSRS